MTVEIPLSTWTHGQVVWALAHGQEPTNAFFDQITYIRRLGIPFSEAEQGKGRGNAVRYGFDHLIELGIAVYALNRRMRPQDVAKFLIPTRKKLRQIYREVYAEIPSAAFQSDWIFSQGKKKALIGEEVYLALHDRHSSKPGTIEPIGPNPSHGKLSDTFGEFVMRYHDGTTVPAVPVKRLIIELVSLAEKAPENRPGRK
jgi:hypothetical protein